MYFRPLPVMTICSLVVLGLLLWLGQWQWQRSSWKTDLIEQYYEREARGELSLEELMCSAENDTQRAKTYPSNAVSPEWLRVFGQSTDGRPGWRIFTAIKQPPCMSGALMAETGFEGYDGNVELINSLRLTQMKENKSAFSNENSPETNEWYWFDLSPMEAALFPTGDNELNKEVILLAGNGLPADLTQTPPSKHIGYSLTWYGMAIALFVLYLAFHIRAGRLRFSKKNN